MSREVPRFRHASPKKKIVDSLLVELIYQFGSVPLPEVIQLVPWSLLTASLSFRDGDRR